MHLSGQKILIKYTALNSSFQYEQFDLLHSKTIRPEGLLGCPCSSVCLSVANFICKSHLYGSGHDVPQKLFGNNNFFPKCPKILMKQKLYIKRSKINKAHINPLKCVLALGIEAHRSAYIISKYVNSQRCHPKVKKRHSSSSNISQSISAMSHTAASSYTAAMSHTAASSYTAAMSSSIKPSGTKVP